MTSTVVLATFNGARFIGEQLQSILGNSILPDELLVVDDGSIDGTLDLVEELLRDRHDQIQIRIEKNTSRLGASRTFIKGARLATSDVIFFCDQDDVWSPEKISRSLSKLESSGADMVHCDGEITDEKLQPTGRTIFSTRKHDISIGAKRPMLQVVINPDVKGCTMALRRSFVQEVLAVEGPQPWDKWGHDHWLALFAFGTGKVAVIKEKLLFHRFHGSNTSGATAFDPMRFSHLKKWMQKSKTEKGSKLQDRYLIAKHYAERLPGLRPDLLRSLDQAIDLCRQRDGVRRSNLVVRPFKATKLLLQGVYSHFNGLWTMMRDITLP